MRRICAVVLALASSTAQAQDMGDEPPVRQFSADEIAAIKMPELAFEPDDGDRDDYDKYFYFHRANTTFDEAFADISECDALSTGASIYGGTEFDDPAFLPLGDQMFTQYGWAGLAGSIIGSAIGSAVGDAIHGSAERRRIRRENMRNCMGFKGYDRYGLEKGLWQEFNFEEGNSPEEPALRHAKLLMQARVAAGPKPQQEVLEP